MRKSLKLSVVSLLFVLTAVASGSVALAAETSSLLPPEILRLLGLLGPQGVCASQYIRDRTNFAFFLVLGGLVIASVIYSIIAAYKYITSQGDTGKIEEANKSIKAIFMGIAAMVVGIVGMVIVFTVVGARPTSPALFQVCINAPSSKGCKDCQDDLSSTLCTTCEGLYEDACARHTGENVGLDTIEDEIGAINPECIRPRTN